MYLFRRQVKINFMSFNDYFCWENFNAINKQHLILCKLSVFSSNEKKHNLQREGYSQMSDDASQ